MITIIAGILLLQSNHPDSVAARARQLADTYLVAYFDRHPDEATLDGVARGPHDRWPDNSPQTVARWQQREDAWLAQLKHIDVDRIEGRPEAIAYGIMREAIESSIALGGSSRPSCARERSFQPTWTSFTSTPGYKLASTRSPLSASRSKTPLSVITLATRSPGLVRKSTRSGKFRGDSFETIRIRCA